MKKYKVALIHNIIAPYRVPLFENLYKHDSIDLTVYYCSETHSNRKWDILQSDKYKYEILSGLLLEHSRIKYHINPSIIYKLISGKYDAVILGGNPDFTIHVAFLVCKVCNIPVIWWSESCEVAQSKLGELIKPLTKYIVKNVESIIVPSTLSKEFHTKLGGNSDKIFIAHNIVDNCMFREISLNYTKQKDYIKEELGIQNKKVLLFVGRLVEGKGVQYLIQSYNKLKSEFDDICLILVGDGNYRNHLEDTCKKEKIKDVFFLGWLSEERIKYYAIADIFVLPTLKDLCPLVMNEAMVCELPVISTTASGNSKDMIISGKNGYIVDAGNYEQLYSSIKKIVYNDDLQVKMGKESYEIIMNEYTIEHTVDAFFSAIEYSVNCKSN